MDVSRRQFFKICAGGMAGNNSSSIGLCPEASTGSGAKLQIITRERDP